MVELGNSLHLALEEASCLTGSVDVGVRGDLGPDQLNSDLPIDERIRGKVDFTHTTAAEPTLKAIAT